MVLGHGGPHMQTQIFNYLMDGYGEKVLKKQMQNKATHLKDSKKWQEDQSLHDASHIITPVQISP